VIHINYLDIPMPNEIESDEEQSRNLTLADLLSSFVRFLRKHITIEEIILIGLILVLIDEPGDNSILIVLLIYVLLF